jgi:Protein of unknown function (DUF1153)
MSMVSTPVTHDELLQPIRCWTALAKFWLCDGLRRGTITITEARDAHDLSIEEILAWFNLFAADGLNGLRNIHKSRSRVA